MNHTEEKLTGEKKLEISTYVSTRKTIEVTIRKAIHKLPTWMFPEFIGHGGLKTPCPVCHQEMRLNIAHGTHIETCSFIELSNGEVLPIHTECFNSIGDPTYKVNHFNQATE